MLSQLECLWGTSLRYEYVAHPKALFHYEGNKQVFLG